MGWTCRIDDSAAVFGGIVGQQRVEFGGRSVGLAWGWRIEQDDRVELGERVAHGRQTFKPISTLVFQSLRISRKPGRQLDEPVPQQGVAEEAKFPTSRAAYQQHAS